MPEGSRGYLMLRGAVSLAAMMCEADPGCVTVVEDVGVLRCLGEVLGHRAPAGGGGSSTAKYQLLRAVLRLLTTIAARRLATNGRRPFQTTPQLVLAVQRLLD